MGGGDVDLHELPHASFSDLGGGLTKWCGKYGISWLLLYTKEFRLLSKTVYARGQRPKSSWWRGGGGGGCKRGEKVGGVTDR